MAHSTGRCVLLLGPHRAFTAAVWHLLHGMTRSCGDSLGCQIRSIDCTQVLEGHGEAVLALAVGNGHLVSGSYDTTVRAAVEQVGACPCTWFQPLLLQAAVDRDVMTVSAHGAHSPKDAAASICSPQSCNAGIIAANLIPAALCCTWMSLRALTCSPCTLCRCASGRWTPCTACSNARATRMQCACWRWQTAAFSLAPMTAASVCGPCKTLLAAAAAAADGRRCPGIHGRGGQLGPPSRSCFGIAQRITLSCS